MLLSGRCEVDGLEDAERLSFVARDTEGDLIFVYGRPALDVVHQVVARQSSPEAVLCLPEDRSHVAEALPEWRSELATIYRLADGERAPEVPVGAVRLLAPAEVEAMDHTPAEL